MTQDPSFERIHPDDAVDCAASEAACRRRHNLTLALLGTLADSGRTSFADDRHLFMAWQVTRLLAPSWNEPPHWFVQRHIEDRHFRAGEERGGHQPRYRPGIPIVCDHSQVSDCTMHELAGRGSVIRSVASVISQLNTRAMRLLVALLDHALQAILPWPVTDARQRRIKMRYTDFSGWHPGHLAGDVLATSGDYAHDKHCLSSEFYPRRLLEAA